MVDIVGLRKWWDIFVGDGNFTEIRILGKFSYGGYFRDFDNLAKQIEPYTEMDCEQLYFVMNKIDDSCYGRQQCEKIIQSPKNSTKDDDIVRRQWVLCDFDSKRVAGTNSTDEQFELAKKKAGEVYHFLKDKGFSDPVICNSGNGTHLVYKIDAPVSPETTKIIADFFDYMSSLFTDEFVEFDTKNKNDARLCKLYSTVAKKGANIPSMPWRQSKILYVPKTIEITPLEKFKELGDLLPKEEEKPVTTKSFPYSQYNKEPFNVKKWLDEHGIVYKQTQEGAATKYTLEYCPWADTHSDKKKWDSVVYEEDGKPITFTCAHSHCAGKGWRDFRLFYEPDAYDMKPKQTEYRPMSFAYQKYSEPAPPEIKPEIPELGKKWLDLSEIEDVNLDDLPRIATGFSEIDYVMGGGLFLSESTIISGINGSGKSAWLNTLSLNAIQNKHKVAIWTGELQATRLKRWIVQAACGKHVVPSKKSDGKYFADPSVTPKVIEWMHNKFRLYNNDYSNNYAQILSDMQEPLNEGCELFIIDNLFALDLEGLAGDENAKQKALILKIADFAKKNKVHTILVAHPRKVVTFLRKEDILGSSALQNAVDNIFIIHRNSIDFQRRAEEVMGKTKLEEVLVKQYDAYGQLIPDTEGNVIEICKNREFGNLEKLVRLHYNEKNRHFYDSRGEFPYGWETPPVQGQLDFTQQNDGLPFAAPTTEDAPF